MAHAHGVFISYRHDETGAHAGRLYDRLSDAFGERAVFMDVDSIGVGLDFTQVLDEALASCAVMLVLIGPGWVDTRDGQGNPRLHDPGDYVRREVQAGLQRDIRVVPVLVRDAEIPPADALPEPLRPLATRHAFRLPDEAFRSQAQVLIDRLRPILGAGADRRRAPTSVSGAWSAELVSQDSDERMVAVQLTHERHVVGYKHTLFKGLTVRVDGRVEKRWSTWDGIDARTYEADVKLSDDEARRDCKVAFDVIEVEYEHEGRQLTTHRNDGISITVDGQTLYDDRGR
jgi:hypothetical protein